MLKKLGLFLVIICTALVADTDEDFTVMSYACSNDDGYGFVIHINSFNQMKVGETMMAPVDNEPASYMFNYTDGKGDTYLHDLQAMPSFAQIPPLESFYIEYKIAVTTASDGKTKSKTIEGFCRPIE